MALERASAVGSAALSGGKPAVPDAARRLTTKGEVAACGRAAQRADAGAEQVYGVVRPIAPVPALSATF